MSNATVTLFEVTYDQEPEGLYATREQAEAHAALDQGLTIAERILSGASSVTADPEFGLPRGHDAVVILGSTDIEFNSTVHDEDSPLPTMEVVTLDGGSKFVVYGSDLAEVTAEAVRLRG